MQSWFLSNLGEKPNNSFNQPLGSFDVFGSYYQNTNEIPYIVFIWNDLNQIIGFTIINKNPNISQVLVSLPNAEPVAVNIGGQTGFSTYTYFQPQGASSGLIYTYIITKKDGSTTSRSDIANPPPSTSKTITSQPAPVNKIPTITISPKNANVGQVVTISGNAYNSTDNLDVYIDGVFWDNYSGSFSISYATTKPGPLNASVIDTIAKTNNSAYATILSTSSTPYLENYDVYYGEMFEVKGIAWNGVDEIGLYISGGSYTSTTLLVTGYGSAKYIFNINTSTTLSTGTYTIYVKDFVNDQITPDYTITVESSPTASTSPPAVSYSNNVITATAYSGDSVAIYNGSTEVASGTTTATYTNTDLSTYANFYAKDTTNNTLSQTVNVIGVANFTPDIYLLGNYNNYNMSSFSVANMFPNIYLNGNYANYNMSSFSVANMFPNIYLNGNYNIYNGTSFA